MSSEALHWQSRADAELVAMSRRVQDLAAEVGELRREIKRAPVAPSPRAAIYSAIDAERAWQDEHHVWPADQRDAERLAILMEEVGEVARAVCEAMQGDRPEPDQLRAELVQVAAVAIRWLETMGGGK